MEKWVIEIEKKGESESFRFIRYIDDKANESYPLVPKGQAIMYANAIILGFNPPKEISLLADPSR
jgi:hypothetical protein